MQSKATTVEAYLEDLPADRRAEVAAVRAVIRANLDPAYQETMQYGMIGYSVPHALFPAGYHTDPRQPLPFAALAAQKNNLALYLMGLYVAGSPDGDTDDSRWFRAAWAATGKRLDMGKSCVRFRRVADVPLEVIGQAIARLPAAEYIRRYQAARAQAGGLRGARAAAAGATAKLTAAAKAAKAKPKAKAKAKARPKAKAKAKAKPKTKVAPKTNAKVAARPARKPVSKTSRR
ncbi:MAG: DUF1801 domain-containing protein [Kofleriaceae bacterium]|nr:DUF1801 domain-containing protein [Kofleriaceae bacterium]MBP6836231.1 DUF1801 domain-containing protein [Kofleriaceae bacterium]